MSIESLFLTRQGETSESYMKTDKIIQMISNGIYIFNNGEFIKIEKIYNLRKENKIEKPKSIIITGDWIIDNKEQIKCISIDANILGGFDKLELTDNIIKIPICYATKENVKYYNCELVEDNESIIFESEKDLPFFTVSIGKDYIKDYIMKKEIGGGVYLEYHNTPHFHTPTDKLSSGFIIIGRKIEKTIELTGFKIPFGFGLFMPPYVIHNDCFLIGNWNVIYTYAREFSTALLVCNNELVSVVESESIIK